MKFRDYTKMNYNETQEYIKALEAEALNDRAIGRFEESFIAQELAGRLKNRNY